MPDVPPPDMPDEMLFDLRPLPPVAVCDPDDPDVHVGDGRDQPPAAQPNESVMLVLARRSRYPLNAIPFVLVHQHEVISRAKVLWCRGAASRSVTKRCSAHSRPRTQTFVATQNAT